jgi:hypothetical protein
MSRGAEAGMTARGLVVSAALLGLLATAVAGWTANLTRADWPRPSISIVDVRPLRTSDPALRSLLSHEFAVRVAIKGWKLYPYLPAATAKDNHRDGGKWRLYLDGAPLGDGDLPVLHTPYLTPGTHWIAAELRNVDQTGLSPSIWSEPVTLYVPKHSNRRTHDGALS